MVEMLPVRGHERGMLHVPVGDRIGGLADEDVVRLGRAIIVFLGLAG
jgi:hypothetical protein